MKNLFIIVLLLIAPVVSAGTSSEINVARAQVGTILVQDALPQGPSLHTRLNTIRQRIQAALHYPPIAHHRGIAGSTTVSFQITSDGKIIEVQTLSSSGHSVLDRAAEQSVRGAQPLPWVYGTLAIPIRFDLTAQPSSH